MNALQAKLRKMELSMQRAVLIAAAKAGGEIVREDAARRAPRDSGGLAMKMTIRVSGRESDIHEGSVDVGPDKQNFYGFFQEYGTAHHAPQPFLGPALEQNRARIDAVMKDALIQAIQKVI